MNIYLILTLDPTGEDHKVHQVEANSYGEAELVFATRHPEQIGQIAQITLLS